MPLTVRADAIASDRIVTFSPARAYASPEIVSFAPGFTVVALRPIVNGELFVTWAMAGEIAAPPFVAASAVGATARAVAAMTPMPASLRDEVMGLVNIGISVSELGAWMADAFLCVPTVSFACRAAVRIGVRHLSSPGTDLGDVVRRPEMS